MPKYKTETFGPGNLSWIGPDSAKAGRTEWIDSADADFAALVVDGVVPSGTPVALVSGQLKPYNSAASTDAKVLVGFLYTDAPRNVGRLGVPVFDHGRVNIAKLPGAAFTAPSAANDRTQCVYMTGA